MNSKQRDLLSILFIFLFIFLASNISAIFINPHISNNFFLFLYFMNIFLIWIVPVLLYVKIVDKKKILEFFKLKIDIKRIIIGVLLLGSYSLFIIKSNYGKLQIYDLTSAVIVAAIIEEIAFRGFFLQKLHEYFSFWKAAIISSILFVIGHFIITDSYSVLYLIKMSSYVFGVSLLLSYIFKKTNSLWICILAHSLLNFGSEVLI